MAFQSMLSGAECSTSTNTLSQFLKHTQTDRSLQQDTLQGAQSGAMRPQFRTRPARPGAPEMDAFLHQPPTAQSGFDMQLMRAEMNSICSGLPPQGGAWAHEMQMRGAPEAVRSLQPARYAAPAPSSQWTDEFKSAPTAPLRAEMRPGMATALPPPLGGMMGMGGTSMVRPRMEAPHAASQERIVQLDDAQWDEQFRRLEAADAEAKGKGWEESASVPEDEQRELNELREMNARLRDEVQDSNPRFEELWNALKDPSVLEKNDELAKWEEQLMEAIADEDPINSTHPGGGLGAGIAGLTEMDGLGETEAELRRSLNDVDEFGFPHYGTYEYATDNPFVKHETPFAEGMRLLENNGSLTDAALLLEVATQRDAENEDEEIHRSNSERSRAWQRLGECHAMNEHEVKAIQALEKAIHLDANNLEAYVSLAVSYINEGYDQAANTMLLRYLVRSHPHIVQSNEFPPLPDENTNPWARLNYVRKLFLQAAREDAAKGTMDPDVQVALGILFYSSSSYDQAKDCFQAALESRPDDFQLWNRLGATLANGGKPELATEAYHKALELRPTFTRAIYNLSVSCLNLGAHHQAAEHLLSALALQRSQTLPDKPEGVPAAPLATAKESESLWMTLRNIFVLINRLDLANQCEVNADLDVFRRAGFDF